MLVKTLLATLLVAVSFAPTAALALPSGKQPDVPARPLGQAVPQQVEKGTVKTPKVVWPRSGKTTIDVPAADAAPKEAKPSGAESAAVAVRAAKGSARSLIADGPGRVSVEVLDRRKVEPFGGVGLGFRVRRADAAPASGPIEVVVDYSGFGHAYGGDFAQRLQLTRLPACTATMPNEPTCRQGTVVASHNDAERQTLTATVDAAPDGPSPLLGAEAVTYALTSGSSSDKGDYRATPTNQSGKWNVSLGSGAFTYNVPIEVPKPPVGSAPELALNYNSQSIDGRTSASNNQASWVGMGWDLNVGHIERKYKNCIEDGHGPDQGQQWGDLCWDSPNSTDDPNGAVYQITLGGESSELIQDDTGTGAFHMEDDKGWKIQKLSGNPNNPDNNNEFWVVTKQDGTRYYFGWGRSERDTSLATRSVLTVPVIGDDAGEPCYDGGQPTYCNQAWKWNLDRVVDPNEVETSYFYDKERNYYRSVAAADKARGYDAGSYLTRIEYGWSSQISGAQLPARVVFQHLNRCKERLEEPNPLDNTTASCPTIDSSPESYPDVPTDLICDGSSDDYACAGKTYYPTFFQRDLLWDITTQVRDNNAAGWDTVMQYQMRYAMMNPDGEVGGQLWLDYIQRRGYSGDDITLPAINFDGAWQDNLVGTGTLNFRRVEQVVTDTGSTIDVTYGHATDDNGAISRQCDENDMPSQANNDYECFWQKWTPEGETEARTGWFKKFVVTQVRVDPGTYDEGDPAMTTTYEYDGAPGWAFTANPLVKDADETWSEWRGYGKVLVTTGAGANVHSTYHWFHRGLDGDRTSKTDASQTRSVKVTDSEGTEWTDSAWLAGRTLETSTRDNAGKSQKREWHEYWVHNTAQYTGLPDARFVREKKLRTVEKAYDSTDSDLSTWREHIVETEYDDSEAASTTFGLPMRVDDWGESSVSDNHCTEYGRAYNTADMPDDSTGAIRWMVYQDDERHYNVGCTTVQNDKTAGTPFAHLDRRTATYYDGSTTWDDNNTALVDGNATETRVYTDADVTGARITRANFDDAGRAVKSYDGKGNATTTTYNPATSWPVNGVVTTSPDPDGTGVGTALTSTVYYSRFWGEPWKSVDAAGSTTQVVYDGVGRTTKVFKPTESANYPDGTASMTFDYLLPMQAASASVPYQATGAPLRVTTKVLQSGTTYASTHGWADGLGRTLELQVPAPSGTGMTVTVTRYDSSGNVAGSSQPFYNSATAGSKVVNPAVSAIPSYTDYVVDWAGRTTVSQYQVNGEPQTAGKVTTSYGGVDLTTVTPAVGQPVEKYTDVYGQTVKVVEHVGAQSNVTTYEYTRSGGLKYLHDANGNSTHYTYNFAGDRVTTDDPDSGATSVTYDANGNVATAKDGNGTVLTYAYDALQRPTTVSQGSTVLIRTAYDNDNGTAVPGAKGRVTSTTSYDAAGNAYTGRITAYDARGRATTKTVTVPNAGDGTGLNGTYTFKYGYDSADHVTSVQYPAIGGLPAETVTSTYSGQGRLSKVSSALTTYLGGIGYDDYGRTISRSLGVAGTDTSMTRTLTYDDSNGSGWLKNITTSTLTGGISTKIQDDTYTRDTGGDVTALRENIAGQQQCFTYDDLKRLTGAWTQTATTCGATPASDFAGPDPYQEQYTHDRMGNLQSLTEKTSSSAAAVTHDYHYPGYSADESTYTADTARPHAVTSVVTGSSTDSYGYDDAGRMTARTVNGVSSTLVWSPLNRVTSVKTGSDTTSYVHDSGGNVLLRSAPAEKVLYLDGHELHKAGAAAARASRFYSADGTSLAVRTADGTTNGKLTWLLSDNQASTQLLVAVVGGTVTRRRYKPFGKQRGTTAGLPGAVDRGYVGQPEDDSTGLSMLGARMYDPVLARFLSPDELTKPYSPQEVNAYSYAANNPVAHSDPSGLEIGSRPNSCQYSLENCDRATQDAVGYDRKTGKVDYTRGTAVGDGSIVAINSGYGTPKRTKLPVPVYNWLKEDLGYQGSRYVTKGEAQAWIEAMGDDKELKDLQEAAGAFYGCFANKVSDGNGCMKKVKKSYKDKLEKEDEGFWGKVGGILKDNAGAIIGVGAVIGCAFAGGPVGIAVCGAVFGAVAGVADYGLSDEENKTAGGYLLAGGLGASFSAAGAGATRWVAPHVARVASNRNLWNLANGGQ
ncbi:RHS repeat-associated core domain-containing protein [Streptomyces nigra]|uniref:RHS repeat-associated core domain-containing protein n=1 Tax=Streptomyces nigra TaxID=1827580 RepID=UPI003628D031